MMATVMVIEVLFDKLYVAVGVLLRAETLIDPKLDFLEQVTVHGALLLPALMTALDVQDALDLSDHMETLLETTAQDKKLSTVVNNVATTMSRVIHHPVFLWVQRVGLVVSILLGLMLGTYTQWSVVAAKQECEQKIGSIASCADKKYYFADGFFNKTTCAFHQVTAFKCSKEGENALNPGMRVLPDAEDEWASMTSLNHIDLRNSSLESAPTGWARVPSKLAIDLSYNKHFFQLPFVICAFSNNLSNIELEPSRSHLRSRLLARRNDPDPGTS